MYRALLRAISNNKQNKVYTKNTTEFRLYNNRRIILTYNNMYARHTTVYYIIYV